MTAAESSETPRWNDKLQMTDDRLGAGGLEPFGAWSTVRVWEQNVAQSGKTLSKLAIDQAYLPPLRHLQLGARAFGLGAILPHSSTPSLRVAGIEDEDDDEDEYEAPGEGEGEAQR
jgi:hypothetical protein